jgi:hypothetical protein
MREKLSPRRVGITERLTFRPGVPGEVTFDVTFGYELGGPVKEAFTLAFKLGSDYQDLMHQACMLLSIALQSGQSMADIARVMGEDNPGNPAHSMIGLVVRAGVVLDDWLTAQHALVRGPSPIVTPPPVLDVETIFDDTNDDELDEGISSSDLAEEDGGTLQAAADCHDVGIAAGMIDRLVPSQINGMRIGASLHLVPDAPVIDLARDMPAFLRRSPEASPA